MKFRDDIPESGGGKNFLKLKDKESVVGIFRGEPHEYFAVFKDGRGHEVSEDTKGARFRFRINFVVKEGASYVPKIFDQSATVYRQLAELHKEYDLESTAIKITRNGSGMDTEYSLLPLLKQQPSKETLEFLEKLELLPLESKGQSSQASEQDSEEIPF